MLTWKKPRWMLILFLGVILLLGCAASQRNSRLAAEPEIPQAFFVPGQQSTPAPEPKLPRDLPNAFSQLIPFDGIYPIYEPVFISGQEAPYADEELILGIAWDGVAKAYPISVLRFREMVDDELAGIPTLVTY
jgi:hypothetical protein